ncbi:phage tail tape measure protein [Anaerotignum sp.]|uniref:phage tail tape measure protein n=1 Tax=Anaerotignum sp. TaxID=2039241 RepID=UPI0028A186F8|nr:phage tail tape measure protein [Anaerotignum sp.]
MIDLGTLVTQIVVNDNGATQQLDNFSIKAKLAEIKSMGLKGALSKLAGGFNIGVAIKETVVGLINCTKNAQELQGSLNDLQIQTGMTDEEMQGMGDTIKNIYAKNLGEDYRDVANALGEVKTQTGLTGEELEKTTQNALLLRDTFDMEVNESIRSVDTMMNQFGITSDEAFNLIVQGSQNGLDKNGNMLDSINEYSVHFQQLGFDADEMFNMFANGAEAGVFDVDKLGDAVKEFGIRAKDGSTTTTDAFHALGLDADALTEKFANGGEGAEDAFKIVNGALTNCDDEVLKNQAGVALYGTMWEDMGEDAILALSNTNGEISATNDAMGKVNQIKFDNFGSAMEGIKRLWETSFMQPIGESILPLLSGFATFISEHAEEIRAVVSTTAEFIGSIFEFIGSVISAFVTNAQTEGTYLYAVCEQVRIIFDTTMKAIQDIFSIFTAVFNGDWEGAWNGIKTLVSDVWNGIVTLVKNNLDGIVTALSNMKEAFKKAAIALFNKVKDGFADVWDKITTWIDEKLNDFITTIKGFGSKAKEAGKEIFTKVWDGMKNIWNDITDWIGKRADDIKDTLMFWKDKAEETKKAKREAEDDSVDGSNRNGLSYVPFDGYKSILHEGERVLTKPEAERYRKNEGNNGNTNVTNNFYGVNEEKTAFKAYRATKKAVRDLGLRPQLA